MPSLGEVHFNHNLTADVGGHDSPMSRRASFASRSPEITRLRAQDANDNSRHRSSDSHDKHHFADPYSGFEFENEQDLIVWELLEGNRKYVKWLETQAEEEEEHDVSDLCSQWSLKTHNNRKQTGYLQQIEEDRLGANNGPLRPIQPKALTLSCARSFSPMDRIFSTDARLLMSVRVAGYTCAPADSVIGSVEYALAEKKPPLLLVVGNAKNDVVAAGLHKVLREHGSHKSDLEMLSDLDRAWMEEADQLGLVQLVLPAAHDAIRQLPHGTYNELLDLACRMNIWHT